MEIESVGRNQIVVVAAFSDRRRYIAAAQLAMNSSGEARIRQGETGGAARVKPGHTLVWQLKQIDAGLLNVGYAEAGPANGPAVILLHGWPTTLQLCRCRAMLASAGYRLSFLCPCYGTTRFLSGETFRNGQPSAVAVDTIA